MSELTHLVAVLGLAAISAACGGLASTATSADGSTPDGSTPVPLDATVDSGATDGVATASDGGAQSASPDAWVPPEDVGVPVRLCDPTSCPTGCCTAEGLCSSPPTSAACGYAGRGCTACPAGAFCEGGACLTPVPDCGPSNCAGCCEGADQCATGIRDEACGHGGEQCSSCLPAVCAAQAAGGGQCAACEDTCYGCCGSPTYCDDGLEQNACGSGGGNCQACGAGEQCVAASTSGGNCAPANPACNGSNCMGCCQGDICAVGDQDVACGAGGANCVDCAINSHNCVQGGCS